jgi:hypothetical protein
MWFLALFAGAGELGSKYRQILKARKTLLSQKRLKNEQSVKSGFGVFFT